MSKPRVNLQTKVGEEGRPLLLTEEGLLRCESKIEDDCYSITQGTVRQLGQHPFRIQLMQEHTNFIKKNYCFVGSVEEQSV